MDLYDILFAMKHGHCGDYYTDLFAANNAGEWKTVSGPIVHITDAKASKVKSLKAQIEPVQDGTPWIGSDEFNNPYLSQSMPQLANAYNTEMLKKVVGGTVAWNQLIEDDFAKGGNMYVTSSVAGDEITITSSADSTAVKMRSFDYTLLASNHVYIMSGDYKSDGTSECAIGFWRSNGGALWDYGATSWMTSDQYAHSSVIAKITTDVYAGIRLRNAVQIGGYMVAKNIALFDLTQMFGTTIADYIYSLEQSTAGAGIAFFKALFPEDYYPYNAGELMSVQASAHVTKDSGGNVLGNYALDSSLTLRGIPKLDANNSLYYDGDEYLPSGSVNRKYGMVDLGTLTWSLDITGENKTFWAVVSLMKKENPNGIVAKYTYLGNVSWSGFVNNTSDKIIALSVSTNTPYVMVKDSAYTDAASFKASMSGVMLVYELDTPTTESATPYTQAQTVDASGTEGFTAANIVPVGHVSTFAKICPISGHTGVTVRHSGADMTNPDIIPISWQSTAGTVYGGTVDVVTGELTVDRASVDLGTLTNSGDTGWKYITNDGTPYFCVYLTGKKPGLNMLCSAYGTSQTTGTGSLADKKIGASSNDTRVYLRDSAYTDLNTFISAMSGVQLVYELATPPTIQLTPQEIRTLLGTNNIWSDTGDTEVTYRAKKS